jgi:hypothetical protein
LPAAIFRNGAASSFRAKQMSVDIFISQTLFRQASLLGNDPIQLLNQCDLQSSELKILDRVCPCPPIFVCNEPRHFQAIPHAWHIA